MILLTGILGLLTGAVLMYGWTRPSYSSGIRKVCHGCGITYFFPYDKPDTHKCEDFR